MAGVVGVQSEREEVEDPITAGFVDEIAMIDRSSSVLQMTPAIQNSTPASSEQNKLPQGESETPGVAPGSCCGLVRRRSMAALTELFQ